MTPEVAKLKKFATGAINNPRHDSDSLEQREAEVLILVLAQEAIGCSLVSETLSLTGGAVVNIDGINHQHRIICEIYSRIGKLKGSQPDKLASDMLKLVFAEQALGGTWRKFLCLADANAAKYVQGKSWLAAAARQMGFKIVVVELSQDVRERILGAQKRQVMANPNASKNAAA